MSYLLAAIVMSNNGVARTVAEYDSRSACNQAITKETDTLKQAYRPSDRFGDRADFTRSTDAAVMSIGNVTFIYSCTSSTGG